MIAPSFSALMRRPVNASALATSNCSRVTVDIGLPPPLTWRSAGRPEDPPPAARRLALVSDPGDLTTLLRAHAAGDPGAFDRLVPLVYEDLRRVARRQLRRGRPGGMLET